MADTLEVRIAHLEGAYEQIDKRLAELRQEMQQQISGLRQEMQQQISGLRQEVSELRQEMQQLRQHVQEQFRWTLGFQILAWITLMGAVLASMFRH